jgi:SAM-dependent methyltransferase
VTPHACIVCRHTRWAALYRGLVRCESCGFVRAAELPSPDALARLYGSGYFHGEEYADYLGDREVHRLNFRRRFDRISSIAGPLESLYEIGCAYGAWLEVARERGVRAAGIDISSEAVGYACERLGLSATAGAFEDAAIEPGEFQAFCMWDTLEHLAYPEAHLERIAGLLPAGGWFFATTGDIGSPTAQRQADRWRMIHPPTHLQYFSRDTVRRFLSRHGLRTQHIESEPMWRSLHGALGGMQRFGPGPMRAAARVASAVIPAAVSRRVRFSLDLGDIMLVCARKE